ncbi:hypothetical protein T439DRAFT_384470 [Meredithblackwellia eburnea MCA 4105]
MFDQYVEHQAAAANLVRHAFEEHQATQVRLAELEAELSVWKLGHREAVRDREDLEQRVRGYEHADPIVLCLLDGDICLFSRTLISQGHAGGISAANTLLAFLNSIWDEHENVVAPSPVEPGTGRKKGGRKCSVKVEIWYNKKGLGRIFQDCGLAKEETLTAFVQGFNSAHPLFTMTDVGPAKEAADAKFRATLALYSTIPHCQLIVAGCAHDGGYASPLQTLLTTSSLSKSRIRLLKSYDEPTAIDLARLGLQECEFVGLFERKKLVSFAGCGSNGSGKEKEKDKETKKSVKEVKLEKKESSLSVASPSSATSSTASAVLTLVTHAPTTPKKEKKDKGTTSSDQNEFTPVTRKEKKFTKQIDPKKSLSKQNPPPCNLHYLSNDGCSRSDCKYSHDYILTQKQLGQLKADAKKSPCMDLLFGRPCENENCLSGHECPWGSECRYGNECRFKADGMHPDGPRAPTSDSYSDTSSY